MFLLTENDNLFLEFSEMNWKKWLNSIDCVKRAFQLVQIYILVTLLSNASNNNIKLHRKNRMVLWSMPNKVNNIEYSLISIIS